MVIRMVGQRDGTGIVTTYTFPSQGLFMVTDWKKNEDFFGISNPNPYICNELMFDLAGDGREDSPRTFTHNHLVPRGRTGASPFGR